MEVNGVFQVPHLDPWQGSFSTGGEAGQRKPAKDQKEKDSEEKKPEGVTKDESGVVHVDLVA